MSLAIAQPQKSDHGVACEPDRGEYPLTGERLSAAAVNQANLVIVARHGRQLPAHGPQGEEESAIHDRDSSTGSGAARLKAEVFTLQKTGTSHFALTGRLTTVLESEIIAPKQFSIQGH